MQAYAAMLCAAGLPPGERHISQGLSHSRGTLTSADSHVGSCSPKLKQALAEILVLLDSPLPDVGNGTEPCRLVWSGKRAESQQECSCAAGGFAGAPGCSAYTKELRQEQEVPFI